MFSQRASQQVFFGVSMAVVAAAITVERLAPAGQHDL
jgi:hypothetical protein